MALDKRGVSVNFSQGLDTKSDPNQLPLGKFEVLSNSIFDTLGRLTKRNGFQSITSLPDETSTFLTTFKGSLTALGGDLKAFSSGTNKWYSKGRIDPVSLEVLPLVRNSTNQSKADAAIAPNGLVCTAYTDDVTSGSTTASVFKYVIADSTTGQNIVPPTTITSQAGAVVFGSRVFALNNYFIVAFAIASASANTLQYFYINSNVPTAVGSVTTISASYSANSRGSFDGVVANNTLFFTWNGATNSGIKSAYLTSALALSSEVTIGSGTAHIVSVTADNTGSTPVIWSSWYAVGTNSGRIVATNQLLQTIFSSREFIDSASAEVTNIAMTAENGLMNLAYESLNYYPYATSMGSQSSNYISTRRAIQATGSLTAASTLVRSVGLASKGFLIGSTSYFLTAYNSENQSTYFLINSAGGVVSKLAYGNGGGYVTTGLPGVTVTGNTASFAYLFKEEIQAVNKETNVTSTSQVSGIYSQLGVNLASYTFGTSGLISNEIGNNLNINGGLLWSYDGFQITENGFNLYPEDIQVSNPGVVGSLSNQTYFYRATYEWSDNQGNLFRSAPSIPVRVVSSGLLSANVLRIPTLRLTYKTQNPVKIVIYRWSQAQQIYYQVTSIQTPILNSTTEDSVSFTDYFSDNAILGNNILYTTGGVLENIAAPSFNTLSAFDGRLWGIDAENPDVAWYSKQILQNTPVEMTDLQTVYVSPNSAAQGPTGPLKCLAPMDDKLIFFKKNAIYYLNGVGPDATGLNNQYSEPIFITATVGCDNPNSIVLIPQGLMFQSDKGIWLLGRDLSTQYIGQDVEGFNDVEVLSAVAVPGTNQVRFALESGITLMYDYFVSQWGDFTGIDNISSTVYENKHAYINEDGQAFLETDNYYLDGGKPVLMSFRTGWVNVAGIQGYARLYRMYMLGNYKTPHKLSVGIGYDYDPSVSQLINISPTNYTGTWGSGTSWGSIATWGGETAREQWQINPKRQQCQSFQITFKEFFDASKGVAVGAGLTVSGLDLVVGVKKTYPRNIGVTHKIG